MNKKLTIKTKITMSDVIEILVCLQIWNTYTVLLKYGTLFRWGMVVCLVLQALYVRGNIVKHIRLSTEQKIWIVSLLYFWSGIIYSVNRQATIKYCVSITTASFLILVILKRGFYKKCYDFIYILLLFSLVTIYLNFLIPNLMTDYLSFLIPTSVRETLYNDVLGGIYSGIFADRANAAFGLNIGFAISYAKYITQADRQKKYLILAGLFFGGIIFTGKRTLLLIPVIIVLVSLMLKSDNKQNKRKYVAIIILCICAVVLLSVFPTLRTFFVRDGSDDLLNSRSTVLWPVAFKMFNSHKLLGIGINTYNSVLNSQNIMDATLSTWSSHAHNIYIQMLGETGIIGFVLLVCIVIVNIRKTIKLLRRKNSESMQVLLIISLFIQLIWAVYGLTGNTFFYAQQLLCYLFALATKEAVNNEKGRSTDVS